MADSSAAPPFGPAGGDPILDFFTRQAQPTPTLTDILGWDDGRLEHRHDFIQLLFPLPEASLYNARAPLVTEAVFAAFRARDARGATLRTNLRRGLERMLRFYGLAVARRDDMGAGEAALMELAPLAGGEGAAGRGRWVPRATHHHLRFTRMIRALRVLGCGREAMALFKGLERVADEQTARGVGAKSRRFWARAALRPLDLPPDEDDDFEGGAEFLKRFEAEGLVGGGTAGAGPQGEAVKTSGPQGDHDGKTGAPSQG